MAINRACRPPRHANIAIPARQANAGASSVSTPRDGAQIARGNCDTLSSSAHPTNSAIGAAASAHAFPRAASGTASAISNAASGPPYRDSAEVKLCGIQGITSTFPRATQSGKMPSMARPIRRPTGPPKPRTPLLLMRVWDAPTRLFHWAIVLLLIVSYVSVETDRMSLHYWSGYAVMTLLLFRLVWGVVGSETSRFRQFLRSPAAGFAHLAAFRSREPDREIGHNAAGGWMVLFMLAALVVQVATGLFAGDPIEGGGPFVEQVAKPTQKLLDRIHDFNFNIILGLVGLHILAVLAYAAIKRHDLVRPMVTGKKRLPATMRQPRFVSPVIAAAILAVAAAFVWGLIRFG